MNKYDTFLKGGVSYGVRSLFWEIKWSRRNC